MLQGDSLAVQLFIGAAAISVFGIAITQAGWTHRWFVLWMFVLAALLTIASVGWRYLEIRIPIINDALQAVASSRIAWFFIGIVPALAAGMLLSDSLRRRREATMRPSEWLSVSTAMDTLARQDLIDRYQYVQEQFRDAADKHQALEQQISELTSQMPLMADDAMRTEAAEKYVKLIAEQDATARQSEDWIRTQRDCLDALRTNIHDRLKDGQLIAKGFLAPHTPGDIEKIIPREEWRFLLLDDDGDQALGPNFEYIALLIAKPRSPS
jgi:hypothetical protein